MRTKDELNDLLYAEHGICLDFDYLEEVSKHLFEEYNLNALCNEKLTITKDLYDSSRKVNIYTQDHYFDLLQLTDDEFINLIKCSTCRFEFNKRKPKLWEDFEDYQGNSGECEY